MIRFFLTVSPRIRIYIKFKNIYTKCFEKKPKMNQIFEILLIKRPEICISKTTVATKKKLKNN